MRFVDKLKQCVKDNPKTIGAIILETVFGGLGGYGVYETMQLYADKLTTPWNVIVPVAATLLAYALVVALTVKAGYENIAEANVRKIAAELGVSEISDMLIALKKQNDEELEKKKIEEQAIADQKAKEDAIIAAYEAEQKAKMEEAMRIEEQRAAERENAERIAKINAYKMAHPELFDDTAK